MRSSRALLLTITATAALASPLLMVVLHGTQQGPLEALETFEVASIKPAEPSDLQFVAPRSPFPYRSEDVLIRSVPRGSRIGGILTLPNSAAAVPAVILIAGSGPQDRDGVSAGPLAEGIQHKPLMVLADHLTRNGIAVLRVDQRGVGQSTAVLASEGQAVIDVLAEIEYLSSRKEIDSKRIGLIGSSGGGNVAAEAATKSKQIRFIVLMAAPGLPANESWQLQGASLLRAYGQSETVVATNYAQHKQIFDMLKSGVSGNRIREQMDVFEKEQVAAGLSDELRTFVTVGFDWRVKNMIVSNAFRSGADPQSIFMKVKCSVLALNGEVDVQVPYREHLAAIESALRAGGNTDFSIQVLPRLNHSFQTVTEGLGIDASKIVETMSGLALQTITDWIKPRVLLR